MANPGVPGSQIPHGEDFMQRQIKDLQRDLRELAPSVAASIRPTVARLDATDVAFAAQQATLTTTVSDLATAQGTLATTVSDLTTAQADIAANVASINDLITKVVQPQSVFSSASNFGLTVAWAAKTTITVTVPAGFTTVQVMAAGRLCATNSTATQDGLYTKLAIGASTQPGFVTGVDPGKSQTSVSTLTATIPGLTGGGTVDIVLWGSTLNAAWATYTANTADLSVSLLWLH